MRSPGSFDLGVRGDTRGVSVGLVSDSLWRPDHAIELTVIHVRVVLHLVVEAERVLNGVEELQRVAHEPVQGYGHRLAPHAGDVLATEVQDLQPLLDEGAHFAHHSAALLVGGPPRTAADHLLGVGREEGVSVLHASLHVLEQGAVGNAKLPEALLQPAVGELVQLGKLRQVQRPQLSVNLTHELLALRGLGGSAIERRRRAVEMLHRCVEGIVACSSELLHVDLRERRAQCRQLIDERLEGALHGAVAREEALHVRLRRCTAAAAAAGCNHAVKPVAHAGARERALQPVHRCRASRVARVRQHAHIHVNEVGERRGLVLRRFDCVGPHSDQLRSHQSLHLGRLCLAV
mmetsp:Transcript_108430/g.315302  ORF Transcript_108430/g.315302 Transcript_108430/m.315302 type:complete len:348 (-) Transcript_108430:356-1399(-)